MNDITVTEKVIKKHILASIFPLIKSFQSYVDKILIQVNSIKVNFIGKVKGNFEVKNANSGLIEIPVTIDNDSHTHTLDDINASVDPIPLTIIKRDTIGAIKSAGTTSNNTGFKLANGTDIGTLLQPKNGLNLTVTNQDDTGWNNSIFNFYVEKRNSTTLVGHRAFGWVCNCNYNCRC